MSDSEEEEHSFDESDLEAYFLNFDSGSDFAFAKSFSDESDEVEFNHYTDEASLKATEKYPSFGKSDLKDSSSDESDTVEFNHYTDKAGLKAIEKSGVIKQATNAAFGAGAYGTQLSPTLGRKMIAENNYGTGIAPPGAKKIPPLWKMQEEAGKTDCCIKIKVPRKNVMMANPKSAQNRNILIHEGDIDLEEHSYKVVKYK